MLLDIRIGKSKNCNQKMKILLAPLLLAVSLPAFAEGKPKTYKECIKNASHNNSKWIEYKDDVNKCTVEFGVAGEY